MILIWFQLPPIITGVTFAFSFPHALNSCFDAFVFQNLLGFFLHNFFSPAVGVVVIVVLGC